MEEAAVAATGRILEQAGARQGGHLPLPVAVAIIRGMRDQW